MTKVEKVCAIVEKYPSISNDLSIPASIKDIIIKWYMIFPDLDSFSLAALAMQDPKIFALTNTEIRKIRNLYFPSLNFSERNFN